MVQVETIASYLPGSEPEDGVIQGISHGGNLNGIRKDGLATLDEQHEIQRVDGLQRKVAWAAEDSIQEGANDSSQEGPPCSTLLGERQPDGTFAPIGMLYEGRPNVVPDDVPLVRMRSFSNRSFTNLCGFTGSFRGAHTSKRRNSAYRRGPVLHVSTSTQTRDVDTRAVLD